jgi:hypothetical protein
MPHRDFPQNGLEAYVGLFKDEEGLGLIIEVGGIYPSLPRLTEPFAGGLETIMQWPRSHQDHHMINDKNANRRTCQIARRRRQIPNP